MLIELKSIIKIVLSKSPLLYLINTKMQLHQFQKMLK